MRDWANRIGSGGLAAIVAIVLAGGAIAYRVSSAPTPDPAPALPSDPLAVLESRASAHPADAAGWQRLGQAYGEQGRFAEAAGAYRRATQADPRSAELWSSLGEALARASEHDPMPPEARQAFARAATLDPKDPRARYFLAVEKDLGGDHRGAIDDWLALLRDTPAGAPWEADLVRTIEQVGKINAIGTAQQLAAASTQRGAPAATPAGLAGPSAAQLAAASSIPPSQQQAMAEGMVARLAARLESDPSNVEGWIMLMRSYQTLGRSGEARAALSKAKAANPAASSQLSAAAAQLGVS
jgi:cytochrome c-type biogenesis protein CcmH